jgi:hypothetical protein
MDVINPDSQRRFLGEARKMGDGTMWRSIPAFIED